MKHLVENRFDSLQVIISQVKWHMGIYIRKSDLYRANMIVVTI